MMLYIEKSMHGMQPKARRSNYAASHEIMPVHSRNLRLQIRFIEYTTTSKINQHTSYAKYINAREMQIKQGTQR
jgi:hypothetical protein